jgi:DNA-binding MarR family transcriptional regulator
VKLWQKKADDFLVSISISVLYKIRSHSAKSNIPAFQYSTNPSHSITAEPVFSDPRNAGSSTVPEDQILYVKKKLDIPFTPAIVHTMNNFKGNYNVGVSEYQLNKFQELITKLFQCCQERMQYQCERFQLPDAELRCLGLFGKERYLTAKNIALRMNVVKSRVSKIIDGLIKKNLIQCINDPEDSRIKLLSLTPEGQKKINEINDFTGGVYSQVLSQMAPDQRQAMLTNLDILKASMEAVKELMV